MLNEDLFSDQKDKEIARLKATIEQFKKYDKERKEYYSSKLIRLGQLESYVQEINNSIEDKDEKDKTILRLNQIIHNQRTELRSLQKIMSQKNIDIEQEKENLETIDLVKLKKELKTLKDENIKLKKEIGNLVYRLSKNEQQ